jgi:hypothetical protein
VHAHELRSAIQDAFLPLEGEPQLHDTYARSGDRVSFAVFAEDQEVYRSPIRALGWREVEAWIDAGREEVERLGHPLNPWIKPEWMRAFLPLD